MIKDEDWLEEDDAIETDADSLLDNDEVSAEEEGFMKGYEASELDGFDEDIEPEEDDQEDLLA